MCTRIGAGDREAEPAADVRRVGARKAFEEARAQRPRRRPGRCPRPRCGDALSRASADTCDRLGAVARRVDQEVGDDAIEHEAVGDDREVVRYVDLDGRARPAARRRRSRRGRSPARAASARRGRRGSRDVTGRAAPRAGAAGARPARPRRATALCAAPRQLLRRARASVVRTPYTDAAGVRSSCDAIATKFAFNSIELHRLLVEPRPLDRQRDPVGNELSSSTSSAVNRRWTSVPTWITPERLAGDNAAARRAST